jgi:hypothetical protein
VVAADPRSPSKISESDLRAPLAILIGQEAAGLSPEIARQADLRVSVPIRAGLDSLRQPPRHHSPRRRDRGTSYIDSSVD